MAVLAPLPDDTDVHEQVDGHQSGKRRGGPEERERGAVKVGGGRGECMVKQVHAHRPGEHERMEKALMNVKGGRGGKEGAEGRRNIPVFSAEPPHL